MEDTSSKLFITVTPKIEMNPTAAEMLKWVPVKNSAQMPPQNSNSTLESTSPTSTNEWKAR